MRREPKKRNPRKTAVNMADKYASLDTRLDGKCVLANKHECRGVLVSGHLFSRIAYSTRWDERNLYCLCSWANMTMENDPMVAEQLLDYARALWGDTQIEELHRHYESAYPVKTFEIQEYAAIWKGKYEKHLGE
jgi:hypothetical protein